MKKTVIDELLSQDNKEETNAVDVLEKQCEELREYISTHFNEETFHEICKNATIDSLRGSRLWSLLYDEEEKSYSVVNIDKYYQNAKGVESLLVLARENYQVMILNLNAEFERIKQLIESQEGGKDDEYC